MANTTIATSLNNDKDKALLDYIKYMNENGCSNSTLTKMALTKHMHENKDYKKEKKKKENENLNNQKQVSKKINPKTEVNATLNFNF